MSDTFTRKTYYAFMLVMPLLFYPRITDMVLLPRQLIVSFFAVLFTFSVFRVFSKGAEIKLSALNLALLAFLFLAAGVSVFNAPVLSESIGVLSKLSVVVCFSVLISALLQGKFLTANHIVTGGVIFGCAAVATALVDIGMKTFRGQHLLHWVYNISGSFANKNLLASILFLCFPFFCIGLLGRRFLKIASATAMIFSLFVLIIIRTRIVLIATIVFLAIVFVFWFKERFRRKAWFVLAFLVTVIFLAAFLIDDPEIKKYFARLTDGHTFGQRILFWQNSIEMFRDHPFGVGLGNWQIYFPMYGLDAFKAFEMVNGIETLQRPHNDFIWVLCETGVFGFFAYISIFAIVLYQSVKLIRSADKKQEKFFSVFLFAGIVGFMIISFFDFPIERVEHLTLLILLFTLVNHQYSLKFKTSRSVRARKIPVLLFAAFAICFSFTVALNRLESEKHVYKMYKARAEGYHQEVLSLAKSAEGSFYQIDSRTIPLSWYQGVVYFSNRDYAQAQQSFERAYSLTPYSIHVINNLASCHEVNGRRENAIELYKKALQISPKFEEARLNLAAVYFNNKEYEKAFNTIDLCSVQTRNPKYKTFLPAILKGKATMILANPQISLSDLQRQYLLNLQDYTDIYKEAKKNNVTFEAKIVSLLKIK